MTPGATQAPYGVIAVEGHPETAGALPGSVTVDLTDLAVALGLPGLAPDHLALLLEYEDQLVPVSWQLDLTPEGDAIVSFLPSEEHSRPTMRLRLSPASGREPDRLPPPGAVEVSETDGVITVRNELYEITHALADMAGLPSRVVWRHTGKVFDTYVINDRLHRRDLGGFLLRNDSQAAVEVLARGPLTAVIRVTARYIGSGPTATNAKAEYLFHYFAGSPVIRVEGHLTQDSRMRWDESHLMEINFPDQSLGRWANSESPEGADLKADQKSYLGSWGALLDGQNVLGMFGQDAVRIYDGRGGYGTYLHGPWVSTAADRLDLSTYLYISAAPNALAELARLADSQSVPVEYELSTSTIAGLLADIRAAGSSEARWAAAMLARETRSGGLARATDRLSSLQAALKKGGDVSRIATDGGAIHMLAGDRLIAGIRATDDGVSLVSLYDAARGREYLRGEQPLWLATFRDPQGEKIAVESSSAFGKAVVLRQKAGARVRWAAHSDERLARVTIRQSLTVTDATLSSTLTVDNRSDATLLDVTPLTLDLARLGAARDDDWVLYPKVSGGLVRDPMQNYPGHSGMYPSGWTTVQFGAFYDPDGGLYFGCHDPEAWSKTISLVAAGGGINARMQWPAPNASLPGNGFRQSGSTVCRLFDGDWFDAARIYRAWAEAEAEWWPDADRPDTPEWMKDIAVWVNASGHAKDCVPKVKAFAEYMGVPAALHWYSWHEIPFDVDYPHYFPAKPGFAEGVAELQEAGVRVMPYINGRLWDTGADDFESTGFPAAAKRESGENYIEEYGSGAKLAPMCPTTDLWRDTVRGLVLRLCGPENNVDGVYIDQVAAAGPALCYDSSHRHPLGGGSWWTKKGYWPLLARLRAELRALSPDKMITTECTAEPYAHRFDGYLSWNFWYGDQVPVVAALYGGAVQLFGRTTEGGDQAVRLKTAQALVWGEQIGWYGPGVIEHPINGPFIRRCARMRYHLRDFLARGRMQHPPTVVGAVPDVTMQWRGGEATYSAVQAGAWSSRDGRLAVIFANALDEPLAFTWELDGTRYAFDDTAAIYTENGVTGSDGPHLTTPTSLEVALGPCEVIAYVLDRSEETGP